MADYLETYKKVISNEPKQQRIVELNVYEDKYDGVQVFTHNDDSKECADGLVSLIKKYKHLTFNTEVTGETLNSHIQETIKSYVEQELGDKVLISNGGCERYIAYTYIYFGG